MPADVKSRSRKGFRDLGVSGFWVTATARKQNKRGLRFRVRV